MRILLISCFLFGLSACDILKPLSPAQETCEEIALSRLKHPGSYENTSRTEVVMENNQIDVKLNFKAWNDYKVPIPHSISCKFQTMRDSVAPILMSIKWNGRPLRIHEIDDIREGLK